MSHVFMVSRNHLYSVYLQEPSYATCCVSFRFAGAEILRHYFTQNHLFLERIKELFFMEISLVLKSPREISQDP